MVCCFEEMSQLSEGGAGHCGQHVLHESVKPLGRITEVTLKLNTGPDSFFLAFLVHGQSSYPSQGEENYLLII